MPSSVPFACANILGWIAVGLGGAAAIWSLTEINSFTDTVVLGFAVALMFAAVVIASIVLCLSLTDSNEFGFVMGNVTRGIGMLVALILQAVSLFVLGFRQPLW